MLIVHNFLIFLSNSSRDWGYGDKLLSIALTAYFKLVRPVDTAEETCGEMGKDDGDTAVACGYCSVVPRFSLNFSTSDLTKRLMLSPSYPQVIHREVMV
jgi:hypothetical protein